MKVKMKDYMMEHRLITIFLLCSCLYMRAEVTVKDIVVKPRWPWNGLVDITYSIECKEKDEDGNLKDVYVDFTAIDGDRDRTIAMKTLTGPGAKDPVKDGGPYTVTWDASKDAPNLNSSALKVQIYACTGMMKYMVVDLEKWTIGWSNNPPDLNKDECRTTQLWLRKVEAGTFTMGSFSGNSNEKPPHDVTITQDYYIGVFECTQKQWALVMKDTNISNHPSYFGNNPICPVERVSYDMIRGTGTEAGAGWPKYGHVVDGDSFMGILQAKTRLVFDLPTEAQWEFAARGGNETKGYTYSGSNNVGAVAWYGDNSGSHTHNVGTKLPNELGIYDMTGNVQEWCLDWYDGYSEGAMEDPVGPLTPTSWGSYRVGHGGFWSLDGYNCRSASRGRDPSSHVSYDVGFRVVVLPLSQ